MELLTARSVEVQLVRTDLLSWHGKAFYVDLGPIAASNACRFVGSRR
jgi:hypothetical protein